MDALSTIITAIDLQNLEMPVKYLADLFAKGLIGAVGKEVWDKIKMRPKKEVEKKVIEAFEVDPENIRNQGKLELLFENWLQDDVTFKDELLALMKSSVGPKDDISIENSKNLIVKSNINNTNGTLHVGDRR